MNRIKNNTSSWQFILLREICQLATGKTPSKKRLSSFGGDIPFVKPGDLDKGIFITRTEETLSQQGLEEAPALPKDTVLVSCIGNLGKKAILNCLGSCNQQINAILPSPYVDSKFIYYYIDIIRPWMIRNASATTVTILNKGKFSEAPLVLPPLAEQKRIVKKIEELFGVIDEQVKRLEATQDALVSYRQSILQQAFSGKLHKTSSWKKITLQEAVDINPKTVLPVLPDSEMVSFLPMPAVQEESLEYREQEASFGKVKKGYTKFQDEDVLFAKITPCMENGKGCIVHNLSHGIGFGSTEFHVLRCHEYVLPKFIYYFVIRRSFRAEAKNKMSGAVGQQRVPVEFLKEYTIALPSLSEQKTIVKKIETAFAFADKAQAAITATLEQAKQLKQSILKRAFEGKLVPQDPNDKPIDLTQLKKDKRK